MGLHENLTKAIATHHTKDGRLFTIRRPAESDAEAIIRYSKIVFASTDQVLTTLEEYTITLEGEKIWITDSLRNPDSLILIAELDGQISGLLFFAPQPKKKNAHTGEFGVSVHPDLQGNGIGRQLVETMLTWARKNRHIEKVFLNVFATNSRAIRLYKELGFVEEGRHIHSVRQLTGQYVDVIQMYVETK